ncbi:hypothetical protein AG0111_0g8539 [Alternaria gaisen]|uniref:Uncharacterized protein n=1 Tax=Alternaria gaisen TaxID=167740 RepID=A0ACB6FG86_9PLEO|nr:hypothetical protein AG0111_0g8539 [Alternaria gaisen]
MGETSVRDALVAFAAERDWEQFHTPENLAKSISIEAAELLECFQWSADAEPKRVREELADVLTYCHLLAIRIGADPDQIVLEKLEVTRKKYPVDKARGVKIENSSLFKLSPYKALTEDQADSVEEILTRFFFDLSTGGRSKIVIQGDPGTGKTVVAIYLIKLLVDIAALNSFDDLNSDSRFFEFFTAANQRLLQDCRIGLVVPQQSLRGTIKDVFRKTRGLRPDMVMTPFQVGEADGIFDLLIVETHRLNQRANQPSGVLNRKFTTITRELFGSDDFSKTQLDWIMAKSRQQIFLLDAMQSVRPADLPQELLSDLVSDTRATDQHFQLRTQMRVQAGSDFVSYIRWIFDPNPLSVPRARLSLGEYDFRAFDTVEEMRDEIFKRNAEAGLSRMVAGYAWEWKTQKDKTAFDIEIGDTRLRWNSTPTDWVSSDNALQEVGSVHTVQGYDLNYVGVIIGLDLRFDPARRRLYIDRDSYFNK